jgi:hypothetical protein
VKRTYQKPRGFTFQDATQRAIRGYEARNRAEDLHCSLDEETKRIARQKRARLAIENPALSDAEIDAMVERIMNGGKQPCAEEARMPLKVPKAVLSARRAERQKQVRGGAPYRR